MPIYQYQCTSCKYEFDIIQKMSDEPLQKCPSCKKKKLVKKVSSGGFILKGDGWYKPGHN